MIKINPISLMVAFSLVLVLGLSTPAFACEDCTPQAKDSRETEKHGHKDSVHKDHSSHEEPKGANHHDHKEGDGHDHDKKKANQ